jgi:phosphoribosylaminoimidazole-succinocarboxamide synthase
MKRGSFRTDHGILHEKERIVKGKFDFLTISIYYGGRGTFTTTFTGRLTMASNLLGLALELNLGKPKKGKVRDVYELPDDGYLLAVTSDAISVFDEVMSTEVGRKGQVLNAINVFWRRVFADVSHDLVAYGAGIDPFLLQPCQGSFELYKTGTVIKKLTMRPYESIARGYLTGGGYREYLKTGEVSGHKLPAGLKDGHKFDEPLFTPSTKAPKGEHDAPIHIREFENMYGTEPGRRCLDLYKRAAKYAEARGIIIADTKVEEGTLPGSDELIFGDEWLTPDSSRFWPLDAWKQSRDTGVMPPSMDKEFVRKWVRSLWPAGVASTDTSWIPNLHVPYDVMQKIQEIYQMIFWKLTGVHLDHFQRTAMKIGA